MAKDKIQIIIIEDETKEIKTLTVSKKKIKKGVISAVLFTLFLSIFSLYSSIKLFHINKENKKIVAELEKVKTDNKNLQEKVLALTKEKEKTVKALAERVKMIDSILKAAGISKKTKNSFTEEGKGGIYIPLENITSENFENSISVVDSIIKNFKEYPLGIPTYGKFSSKFGIRRDPFTGLLAFHPGIDISNKPGTKVRATADGIVIKAGRWGSWGKVVFIKHPSGYTTVYAHLRKIYVKKWQKVKLGEVIGEMGNTGRSTGPHLHYGIEKNKNWINPMKFLEVTKVVWEK